METETEKIVCPTLLAHALKYKILKAIKEKSLQDIASLKYVTKDVFSPQGMVCEVWRQFTGDGDWSSNNFKCKLKGGHYVWAYSNIPISIIGDFSPLNTVPGKKICPLRQLLQHSPNKVEPYKAFFEKMEDFSPVIPNDLERKEDDPLGFLLSKVNFNWKIQAELKQDGKTIQWMEVPISAPSRSAAIKNFYDRHPAFQVLMVIPATAF